MLLLVMKFLLPTGELWGEEGKNPFLLMKLRYMKLFCRLAVGFFLFLLAADIFCWQIPKSKILNIFSCLGRNKAFKQLQKSGISRHFQAVRPSASCFVLFELNISTFVFLLNSLNWWQSPDISGLLHLCGLPSI